MPPIVLPMRRPLVFLSLTALVCVGRAAPAAELAPAWEAAGKLLFEDAMRAFDAAPAEARSTPEGRFAQALLLLNDQPKTAANIEAAREILRGLAAERAGEELGLAARFFEARIVQVHQPKPDPKEAARLFRTLRESAPGSAWGQRALVRELMLRAYEPMPLAEKRALLAGFEEAGAAMPDRDLRRVFHLSMGDAMLRVTGDEAGALRHFLAARELGILRPDLQAWVVIRVASMAARAGDRETALRHYREFLAEYPRDLRVALVRERIAALEQEGAR